MIEQLVEFRIRFGMFVSKIAYPCHAARDGGMNPGLGRWRHAMPDSPQKTKDDPAVLTVHEVAEYLRISEAKVYRLARDGVLPVVRIGKTWRFRRDLLDDWLAGANKPA